MQEQNWRIRHALIQMNGMEHACRLLIAELSNAKRNIGLALTGFGEHIDKSIVLTKADAHVGLAVATITQCAFFCEFAIKTLYFCLSDSDTSHCKGHLLIARNDDEVGLYDQLEKLYEERTKHSRDELGIRIISKIHSPESDCPRQWFPESSDVRTVLKIGTDNYQKWRYGFVEDGRVQDGIPNALFCIGKGLELLCSGFYGALIEKVADGFCRNFPDEFPDLPENNIEIST